MLGVVFKAEHKEQVLDSYHRDIEARRKSKMAKQEIESHDFPSDETFAFIAGYTSGGAPYGITWEEEREIREREGLSTEDLPEQDDISIPPLFCFRYSNG